MTKTIDFSKPITATTTDGEILNFSFDMKIPGHRQIAAGLEAIAEADASQRSDSEIKKFNHIQRGGIDPSKLRASSLNIGNY